MNTISKTVACSLIMLCTMNKMNAQTGNAATDYLTRAESFKANSQPDSAISYYEKAAAEFQETANTESLVDAYNQIGILLTKQNKYEKAKTYLNLALKTGLNELEPDNIVVANSYTGLGAIANAEGNQDQAFKNYNSSLGCFNKAVENRIKERGPKDKELAKYYKGMADVYSLMNNSERAGFYKTKAEEIQKN